MTDDHADEDNILRLSDYQQNEQLPETAEDSIALAFADRHAAELRYVAAWNRWLRHDEGRWALDDTLHTFDLVRNICREIAVANDKPASAVASAKTVAAVERLAKSDRRLAATAGQWDSDPWLLNTPGGVVDLRSAKLAPHAPEDYFTKITTVNADPNCETPLWTAFLQRVTGNDPELIGFLQRMAGYALTGSTQEHALFFHHGVGANGKSTFFNVLSGILGDYHKTAPIETFIASHNERHPTDLASLQGARLVSAIETEEGRRWDESKLKALTGGDPISARFMRQDFFEYTPQFKLIVAGNHKPALRSVDEAIRRRLHLVPWIVVIPPAERDKKLAGKLRREWTGILAWMVQGCIRWQRRGLAPPNAVTNATDAYLEAEDAFKVWIEEYGMLDANAWEKTITLFAGWKAWCEKSGEYVGNIKRFSQLLELRGAAYAIVYQRHMTQGRGFRGLRLIGDAQHYEA
jgi:putative DNA primase/helicase